jgi:hypothetical protein
MESSEIYADIYRSQLVEDPVAEMAEAVAGEPVLEGERSL